MTQQDLARIIIELKLALATETSVAQRHNIVVEIGQHQAQLAKMRAERK